MPPFLLPRRAPKASQNVTKSTKSQPKHEKDEFLKMSTSLTRDTHFRGSRVPKTPPKSTNNAAKVPQKTRRFLHRFLNVFFIDFGSILGPMGGPSWSQNPLKWGEGRGPWNRLGAQGAQARHQTLKISQEASPAIRFNVPWPSLGLQISIF